MSLTAAREALRALTWSGRCCVALLVGLGVALTLFLWPHWRQNPDLSHAFFMPVVFVFLLYESAEGSARHPAAGKKNLLITVLFLLLGLGALAASGLYAASLDWSHSLVGFTLTASYVFFLCSALVVFSADNVRLVSLNWSSFAAAGLWLLCAPFPSGAYMRLTLGLQLLVTSNVLHTLHFLGVAATRHGNVIDLATVSVGVEDACSGVRSLVSCIFVGVLFSATLVRRPWARLVLIGLAAPLALLMNFIRSLALTLFANAGVEIGGAWHDATGYAVLGVTAVILFWLASLLESRRDTAPDLGAPPQRFSLPSRAPLRLLAGGLTLALLFTVFFYANTRPSPRRNAPVPDLLALLPANVPGWSVETSGDLHQFTSTLQTEHLAQRTYMRATPNGPEQFTVYLAYWRAGQAPVSLVASHTPDACWPGSGWEPVGSAQSREQLAIASRPLPGAESRLFVSGRLMQFVWFWHIYDGHPIDYRDPYSASELLSIAWRYGFRHDGDQLFIRVSSNRPWNEISREPLLAEILSRLQPLGL